MWGDEEVSEMAAEANDGRSILDTKQESIWHGSNAQDPWGMTCAASTSPGTNVLDANGTNLYDLFSAYSDNAWVFIAYTENNDASATLAMKLAPVVRSLNSKCCPKPGRPRVNRDTKCERYDAYMERERNSAALAKAAAAQKQLEDDKSKQEWEAARAAGTVSGEKPDETRAADASASAPADIDIEAIMAMAAVEGLASHPSLPADWDGTADEGRMDAYAAENEDQTAAAKARAPAARERSAVRAAQAAADAAEAKCFKAAEDEERAEADLATKPRRTAPAPPRRIRWEGSTFCDSLGTDSVAAAHTLLWGGPVNASMSTAISAGSGDTTAPAEQPEPADDFERECLPFIAMDRDGVRSALCVSG